MKLCIHRGTAEIGGTCIELESQDQRIVLDVGLPLDTEPDDVALHPVPGFLAPDPSLLGVIISHPHQDHYGLAHRLPAGTPFLIGEAARAILAAAAVFSPSGITLDEDNVTHLKDREPLELGPFTITPYLVDHSAYDAYAVLVEADGQRLFYTGDLRAHGRKGALFERLLRDPPRDVDLLLMEGTTIGRSTPNTGFPTEADLERRLVALFGQTPGLPLVWCSGQNIDRLVTVFRACKRSGRQLIVDMYTAHILRATGNPRIPQAEWDEVRVFLPYGQKRRVKRLEAFEISSSYSAERIYPEQLAGAAARSVMLFRPSMRRDLELAGCLEGARLVYSMWSGYLEREEMRPFLAWLKGRGIPLEVVHTSGHAGVGDLRRLRDAVGGTVVAVHTEHGSSYEELFRRTATAQDGRWWTVPPTTANPAQEGMK
jgi:ribonuclease J